MVNRSWIAKWGYLTMDNHCSMARRRHLCCIVPFLFDQSARALEAHAVRSLLELYIRSRKDAVNRNELIYFVAKPPIVWLFKTPPQKNSKDYFSRKPFKKAFAVFVHFSFSQVRTHKKRKNQLKLGD